MPNFTAVTGTLPASTPLKLTIALRPQNASGLENFASDVSTPASPDYKHYLTVAEFASRFGASQTAIKAVTAALSAQGLQVGSVSANDLQIPVNGSAGQIDKALAVNLSTVKLPSGRSTFANTSAPTLPTTVAGYVQGVLGLDDVTPPQPAGCSGQAHRASRQRDVEERRAGVGAGQAPATPVDRRPAAMFGRDDCRDHR